MTDTVVAPPATVPDFVQYQNLSLSAIIDLVEQALTGPPPTDDMPADQIVPIDEAPIATPLTTP